MPNDILPKYINGMLQKFLQSMNIGDIPQIAIIATNAVKNLYPYCNNVLDKGKPLRKKGSSCIFQNHAKINQIIVKHSIISLLQIKLKLNLCKK